MIIESQIHDITSVGLQTGDEIEFGELEHAYLYIAYVDETDDVLVLPGYVLAERASAPESELDALDATAITSHSTTPTVVMRDHSDLAFIITRQDATLTRGQAETVVQNYLAAEGIVVTGTSRVVRGVEWNPGQGVYVINDAGVVPAGNDRALLAIVVDWVGDQGGGEVWDAPGWLSYGEQPFEFLGESVGAPTLGVSCATLAAYLLIDPPPTAQDVTIDAWAGAHRGWQVQIFALAGVHPSLPVVDVASDYGEDDTDQVVEVSLDVEPRSVVFSSIALGHGYEYGDQTTTVDITALPSEGKAEYSAGFPSAGGWNTIGPSEGALRTTFLSRNVSAGGPSALVGWSVTAMNDGANPELEERWTLGQIAVALRPAGAP